MGWFSSSTNHWCNLRHFRSNLFLGSAVGMVRFPDFYTRMHAAGKGDTLSTMLMLGGFGLVTVDDLSVGSWLLLIKILGVVLFYTYHPTSSHNICVPHLRMMKCP